MKKIFVILFIFFVSLAKTASCQNANWLYDAYFAPTHKVVFDSIYSFLQQTLIPSLHIGYASEITADWEKRKQQFYLGDTPYSRNEKIWNISLFLKIISTANLMDFNSKKRTGQVVFPNGTNGDSVYYINNNYLPYENLAELIGNYCDTLDKSIAYWECSHISDKLLCGSKESIVKQGTMTTTTLTSKKLSSKKENLWKMGYNDRMGEPKSFFITIPVFDKNFNYALLGRVEVDSKSSFINPELYIYKRENGRWKRIVLFTCDSQFMRATNNLM